MRIVALFLAICLLLPGCTGWMDGSYVSMKPHPQKEEGQRPSRVTVSDADQIHQALEKLVELGHDTGTLYIEQMSAEQVEEAMTQAVSQMRTTHPITVFVAENITWELGTVGNEPAIAVTVHYNQNRVQIHNIVKASGMNVVQELVCAALRSCDTYLVMEVSDYEETDFVRLVRNYADASPEQVMEVPQVAVEMYPNSGTQRVVELRFTYQTALESLREMQEYVQPVFSAATIYVLGEDQQLRKFDQLHAYLMGRNDYTVATSLTPAYSLLRHGVGDSRAFAVVYAAMCRDAGLECRVVSGTCQGTPHFWNMICVDGNWWHTDLLSSPVTFRTLSDGEMVGYVWDYSAYPSCGK